MLEIRQTNSLASNPHSKRTFVHQGADDHGQKIYRTSVKEKDKEEKNTVEKDSNLSLVVKVRLINISKKIRDVRSGNFLFHFIFTAFRFLFYGVKKYVRKR